MDENLLTPQGNNALLKAAIAANDVEGAKMYYNRLMSLRSNKTKHFALKQGVVIAISAYLNSEEDPTPLNTTWFGQCLLMIRIIS